MTIAEYNQCIDAHADGLYRFILKNLRDKEAAQDVVQDTFEKMWIKHQDIANDKAKSYLFTTGYHTMIDSIRRRKQVSTLTEVNEATLFHNEQYSDAKKIINEAVNLLPAIQKAVVTLRDYEGYSYEEIGNITGLTPSQVKVYIYRARLFLKDYLVGIDQIIG
ncbi:MAG: hypothetical protein RIQ89_311 [Bacteroidota bacterium]|jgi:RNA polymerase sigma factor (sigma-70 family)